MFNAIKNNVGLILLFFSVFSLGLLYFVARPITDGVYSVVNQVYPNKQTDQMYLAFITLDSIVINGFYMLASLMVFLIFISSLVDSTTWFGYILSVLAGLIATPLSIFIVSSFWNTYQVLGITFSQISVTFIESWPLIMTFNFLLGLVSFIFIRTSIGKPTS